MTPTPAWVPSPNYTPAARTVVNWIVIHDEEAKESPSTAEHVAGYFGQHSSHVSAHYEVDVDSVVQSVYESDVAWAAGHTGNARGVHIELSGFAKQTRAEWLADLPMLRRAAELVADIAKRQDIPLVELGAGALLDGERGVTTHAAISEAFRETTHTDPGSGFPLDVLLELANGCPYDGEPD